MSSFWPLLIRTAGAMFGAMSQPFDVRYSGAKSADVVDRRARFIVRTYNHLFGAIVAFAALEFALFASGAAAVIAPIMLSGSWLLVLGAFVLVSWVSTRYANSAASKGAQYAGLAGYVVAEAIVFVPLLYIANHYAPGTIQSAGIVTMLGFGGLSAVAFITKKDFSFLRGVLMFGGILAFVAIIAAAIFGFQLGTFFSVAMVGLAGASILYDTSNVLHHYPEDRYVGAALQLFASVALMFWYVLQLLMSSRRN
jgi:FtsH-binding integral membrane protein